MSENDNSTGSAAPAGISFTERESQMLGWAMQSLKSGPPEIDYNKLAAFAGMSNPRSASNAWALIRKKLAAGNPDGEAIAPTPKKAGRPKKAAAAAEDEDGDATPKKTVTPRKRAAKKQDVDGEASPKKKGRGKKAVEEEAKVREEEEESELPGKAGEMDDEMQEEV